MKYYCIITFGCQMNKNDSEHLRGMLEFQGYKETEDISKANIVVINTCAVRDKAERRVYGQLANLEHLRKTNSLPMKLYLSGCMPAYKKETIKKEIPYLDGFIDIAEARQYPLRRKSNQAWVTIMDGCDNFCSYCIVPYTRGREKSRPVKDILTELAEIDFDKYHYICLLGQNVNSYKGESLDGKQSSFPELLEKIIAVYPKLKKIGFVTSHPKDISEKLIEVIAKNPKIDRELHLPVQHLNNRILNLMNRGYSYQKYKNLITKIRKKIPDIKISTDLIIGFPSETEKEFTEMLRKMKMLKFYRINTAAFSIRTGTVAARLPEQITEKIKKERLNKLNEAVKKVALINKE